jgi:cytochrome c5
MRSAVLFAVLAGALAAAACGSSSDSDSVDPKSGGGTGPAGTGLATGLPCDVQALLENRCIACHDGKHPGSPRLLDYADLTAPSKADPSKSMAQMALIRMRSTTSPMPPPPAAPPDQIEIETFETWVILGTPKRPTACTDPPPAKDPWPPATTKNDGGAPQCATGKAWTQGNTGSPLMHPGGACNACHQVSGGPNLQFGGTVYPAAHEPDDCVGSAPPPTITVTITDSKGRSLDATVNASGNFYIDRAGKLFPPFKASLSDGTKTRAMNGSVTSGDCNSCHTADGLNGAPGRIMAP